MIRAVLLSVLLIYIPPAAWSQTPQAGFPKTISNWVIPRSLVVDLDGDGAREFYALAGDTFGNQTLHGFAADGQPLPGFPVAAPPSSARILAGNVIGSPASELVLVTNSVGIHVFDGAGVTVTNWAHPTRGQNTPALADLDGDGDFEIVASGADERVWAYHGNGTVVTGWPFIAPGYATLPHFVQGAADIDFDGSYEVFVSVTVSGINAPDPLFLVGGDGSVRAGYPIVPQTGLAIGKPAIADLDGQGDAEFVTNGVAGVSLYRSDAQPFQPAVTIPACTLCDISLAELDGDPTPEVVLADWQLTLFDIDTSQVLFQTGPNWYRNFLEVAAADVDGDGISELFALSQQLPGSGASHTSVHAWQYVNGQLLDIPGLGLPVNSAGGLSFVALMLSDLDSDGDVELFYSQSSTQHAIDIPGPPGTGTARVNWGIEDGNLLANRFYHQSMYPTGRYLRGDVSRDGVLNLVDVIQLAGAVFGLNSTNCLPQLDVNDDESVDVSDAVWLATYLFALGPAPAAPFPVCDIGPPSKALARCETMACP